LTAGDGKVIIMARTTAGGEMADTEKGQSSSSLSLRQRLEKLRHPHFLRRLEGIKETEKTLQSSQDKGLLDQIETQLIKLARGDENPAVRDAAFHQLLKRGGPIALGLGMAVGTAYLGAKVLSKKKRMAKEEIEAIFQDPAAFEPKRAMQVAEEAIHFGRGEEFLANLLKSLAQPEHDLKQRLALVQAINPHSPLGEELCQHETTLLSKIEGLPQPVQEALRRVLRQAKGTHSERERLKRFDLRKLL
jgi:hypothetical protein